MGITYSHASAMIIPTAEKILLPCLGKLNYNMVCLDCNRQQVRYVLLTTFVPYTPEQIQHCQGRDCQGLLKEAEVATHVT